MRFPLGKLDFLGQELQTKANDAICRPFFVVSKAITEELKELEK